MDLDDASATVSYLIRDRDAKFQRCSTGSWPTLASGPY
jgi:hypothetical protein